MAEFTTVPEAVPKLVADSALLALEGFTNLVGFDTGHEVVRPDRRPPSTPARDRAWSTTRSSA